MISSSSPTTLQGAGPTSSFAAGAPTTGPDPFRSHGEPDGEHALFGRSTAVSSNPSRIDQSHDTRGASLAADRRWHIACTSKRRRPVRAVLKRLEDSMNRHTLAALAAIFFSLTACASVDVRTVTSPDANLGALHTFTVMTNATPRSPAAQSADDPMLVNSVSNRALRADLVKAFENRGYVRSDKPDFTVAYYASTKQKLDVTYWDYGYDYYPRWWGGWGPGFGPSGPTATEYTQGTVIVDVVNPSTKELLWRGSGVAAVSDNEAQYEQDLWKTVTAILDKFPRAS
jgi:hypothetical protein